MVEALRAAGIECAVTPAHERSELRVKWVLEQLVADPPDIFVPNLVVAGYFAGRWTRLAGIPTIGILHSDDPFYRAIQSEFVFGPRKYQVSHLVCVSRLLEQQVLTQTPSTSQVHRIPYGVPIPSRTRYPASNRLRLAFVGRLAEEQKRISELTRALCRVVRDVPGTEAALYGDGPDREHVEAILKREGVGLPVTLVGRIDPEQMQDRLLEADVIVLLSDYEGLPIAVLEAMAAGVVPVCLRMRSGIPELVEDGVTGLIVEDREEGFVAAVRQLRDQPDLLVRLSAAARARVECEFSIEANARAWTGLLHEAANQHVKIKPMRIPYRIHLPRRNPALGGGDPRPSRVPILLRALRRGHRMVGFIRRKLMDGIS
ncbi:MAG: glycosyltransferase family 4 protein [Chromatiaceae bacterium]|nr:glycosyltransferase family 4 protein [Chromatiaceae bacterium]